MVEVNETASFHVTPGAGRTLYEQVGYSQAVRVGDRVDISGQGGWDDRLAIPEDLDAEIVAAFDDVARVLAEAGAEWSDVIEVTSYHKITPEQGGIGDDHNAVMVREFRTRLEGRAPVWTEVGVSALGLATMNVEIRVTAITVHGAT